MYNELEGFILYFKKLKNFLKKFNNPISLYIVFFRLGFVLYKKEKKDEGNYYNNFRLKN